MTRALIADLGGTHARFALAEGGRLGPVVTLAVADHATALAAILAARAALPGAAEARRFLAAVAGPVGAGPVALTNAPWVLDRAALPFAQVEVLNDLEAMGWALDALADGGTETLAAGAPPPGAPRLVVASGTGLGMAIVLGGRVLATEAGHSAFAPADATEAALLAHLQARAGHVSNEALLSGSGLPRLAAGLAALAGAPPQPRDAAGVQRAAEAGEPLAGAAVALFWRALGGFCGDAVLMTGAQGGVFLAGGAARKLAPLLPRADFLARLRDKPPMGGYLARVPVRLVTHPEPGLLGLAQHAARCAG